MIYLLYFSLISIGFAAIAEFGSKYIWHRSSKDNIFIKRKHPLEGNDGKCIMCNGTGGNRSYTKTFCNSCDGSGKNYTEVFDMENLVTKKIRTKDEDGFSENCSSCYGKGYTINSYPKKDGFCSSCKGKGHF